MQDLETYKPDIEPVKQALDANFCVGYLPGQTQSEGGFAADRVSTASVLDTQKVEKKGKTFYNYEVFTRTADGDEGGRHVLISSAVSGGNLYILKVQIGDKRWFKGAKTSAVGLLESFTLA